MGSHAPNLQRFIQRSKALKLYREALRLSCSAPANSRATLKEHVRHEFKAARAETDVTQINFLLSQGRQRLSDLRQMLSLSR